MSLVLQLHLASRDTPDDSQINVAYSIIYAASRTSFEDYLGEGRYYVERGFEVAPGSVCDVCSSSQNNDTFSQKTPQKEERRARVIAIDEHRRPKATTRLISTPADLFQYIPTSSNGVYIQLESFSTHLGIFPPS
jgi:hypothetical protein